MEALFNGEIVVPHFIGDSLLSYDIAVIQWIMLYHKNHMTTSVITLWHAHLTSLTTSMSIMRFGNEIMFNLKVIKSKI